MIITKTNIFPDEIKNKWKHVLFVEGDNNASIDPVILKKLLVDIRIEALGPSYNVKSVAQALYPTHPYYYFLIDRDHQTKAVVSEYWKNFPNPEKYNLLLWKRREIENYFLEPSYLVESKYCTITQEKLEEQILKIVQDRLFLDVANYVVISIREELKKTWIHKFKNSSEFQNKETAINKLKGIAEFDEYKAEVSGKTSSEELGAKFNYYLKIMIGENESPIFGVGEWLDMIQGKKVLNQIIHSKNFEVKDLNGNYLQGDKKLNVIIEELLQKDESVLPSDFIELKKLIKERIDS